MITLTTNIFASPIIVAFWWTCLNVYHEAQGEPLSGQIKVAHVVANRAVFRGMNVKQVILQEKQFSWTNSIKDPESIPIKYPHDFKNAIMAVHNCAEERLEGFTFHGADHYYNPEKADPSWAHDPRYKFIEQDGNHKFYKDLKSRIK